jgi:hypothetical protein
VLHGICAEDFELRFIRVASCCGAPEALDHEMVSCALGA